MPRPPETTPIDSASDALRAYMAAVGTTRFMAQHNLSKRTAQRLYGGAPPAPGLCQEVADAIDAEGRADLAPLAAILRRTGQQARP